MTHFWNTCARSHTHTHTHTHTQKDRSRSGSASSNIMGHMYVRSNVRRSHCVVFEHHVVSKSIILGSYCKTTTVKWSRYRPGVAQRVCRGIAILFYDRGTRRGWVVSNTTRSHFTPGKDPVPILQVGPRAGLDGRKISSPPEFDPGPSSP